MTSARILVGDCRESMRTLPEKSVQTCITSPPYFGLRDYGHAGQIGLEATPVEFVAAMVDVFREVRRVLADDGTLWLNLGDSYANTGKSGGGAQGARWAEAGGRTEDCKGTFKYAPPGFKPKDLMGIPWRVAFALQADGWYLRSDIVWHKPNPMPESVEDRPTRSHEYVFLLSKSERYFYDAAAVREESSPSSQARAGLVRRANARDAAATAAGHMHNPPGERPYGAGRNKRSVWTIATQPYAGAHFATFPPALAEPCILAGSRPGDTVLDPFGGSGTTAAVAITHGRRAILCELNPAYADLARNRLGLFGRTA